MKQLIALMVVAAALAGCSTGMNGGGDMAIGVFDYEPSGGTRPAGARFGYELAGDGGWSGHLGFEEAPGAPTVRFAYNSQRENDAAGELHIAMPYMEGGVRRYEGLAEDGREVAVRLQAGPCEHDGERFTHFAALRIGAVAVTGCALERAMQDRWGNYLIDFMPAIDLCLTEMRDQAQHVSLAYAMPGGATGVRIVDSDSRTWECVTREGDEAVNSLRPIAAADTLLGEGDPIFVRGVMPEFGEGCYVYESIRHADGSLIGAFGYDACNAAPALPPGDPLTRS